MNEGKCSRLMHKLSFRPSNLWWRTRNGNTHSVSPWGRPDIMFCVYSVENEERGGYVVFRLDERGESSSEVHCQCIYEVSNYLKDKMGHYGDRLDG